MADNLDGLDAATSSEVGLFSSKAALNHKLSTRRQLARPHVKLLPRRMLRSYNFMGMMLPVLLR